MALIIMSIEKKKLSLLLENENMRKICEHDLKIKNI